MFQNAHKEQQHIYYSLSMVEINVDTQTKKL